MSGTLRVLPLGGLGEIGKNMCVVEYDGRIVVVDCGLRFPTAEMMGIDLVLPDFTYLREHVDAIEAIVLTHGHEDHIGALPWVLRELGETSIPVIYGGQLTVAMGRSKLDEHRLREAKLEVLPTGQVVKAGPFEIELVHLTHSIPDMAGVILRCELGTVLFTGTTSSTRPRSAARRPTSPGSPSSAATACCCCAATRPTPTAPASPSPSRPSAPTSSASSPAARAGSWSRASRRTSTACSRSSTPPSALNRKVCLVGRSMRKNVNIGRTLGHIVVPEGTLVPPRELDQWADDRIVIISTGSQGEPLSALRRMAYRDHNQIELREGDTVVFSATPIPGNERAVNETIDRLYQIGCEVITPREENIHASGHGYQEEIKLMLNLTRPRYVMPVHGDYKRLRLHSRLAEAVGVPKENIFQGENGLPLEITASGASWGKRETAGMVFVDGVDIGDVADVALRDRRMLSADGIFIIVATVSEQDGSSVVPPEVLARGVPFLDGNKTFLDDLREAVEDSLDKAAAERITEIEVLESMLHDDLAGFIYDKLKRRPMVLPVVVEV